MSLTAAVRLLLGVAAALSLVVAWRRPDYRHVAAFLAVAGISAAGRGVLRLAVPALALPRVPASVPRAVLHLDQALYLAWPAALVALALGVCLARRHWPALLPWAVALTALAGFSLRAALALELYALLEIAALAFLGGAVVQWSGRGKVPGVPQVAVVLVLVFDGLAFAATRGGDAVALWPSALASYLVLYVCLIVLQGVAWVRSKPL